MGLGALSITITFLLIRFLTLRQLSILSEKGKIETPTKKSTIILLTYVIIIILVAVVLFTYMPAYPPNDYYLFYFILFPATPTAWSTRIIYYYLWEKKNHKQIFNVKGGLWAIPKIPDVYAE